MKHNLTKPNGKPHYGNGYWPHFVLWCSIKFQIPPNQLPSPHVCPCIERYFNRPFSDNRPLAEGTPGSQGRGEGASKPGLNRTPLRTALSARRVGRGGPLSAMITGRAADGRPSRRRGRERLGLPGTGDDCARTPECRDR